VAAEIGVPVINTDEGIKAKWTTEEEDFVLIKYTLQEAAFIAERRNIKIGIEPHAQYSRHPDGLDRIYHLVKSPAIGINFDTGNAYLCGHDVYAWLERVAGRLVHLHAKDISTAHSEAERGKVTGTPVGCACGEGVLDWKRIIGIVARNARATSCSPSSAALPGPGRQEPGTPRIVKVQFQVSGMTCTACEKNISNTLAALEGVSETAACAESKSVTVQFDTAKAKEKNLVAAIEKAGYKVERETVQIKVAGLKGADCSNKVSAKLAKLDGVQQQKVCHVGQVAVVTFDPHQTTRDQVIASINDSGFKALN
jgi:copper ion binding protein